MKKVEVINIKKYDLDDYIYIGRDGSGIGKYGNPYSSKDSKIGKKVDSREKSLELYEEYIDQNPEIVDELINEMNEKNIFKLGCWCKPSKCHGDILVKKIENRKYKSLF